MPPEDDDIQDVRTQEERRGRRPLHKTSLSQKQRIQAKMRQALREGNEALFIEAIIELGLRPGSSEYEDSLKAWRAFSGSSRSR
jgi:hypothetical protein